MKFERLRDGRPALILSESDLKALKFNPLKDYEVVGGLEGFKLKEVSLKNEAVDLYNKLSEMSYKDRVEGVLEPALTSEDRELLKALISKGKVFKYKKDESYKKHLYVTDKEFERFSKENTETASSSTSIASSAAFEEFKTKGHAKINDDRLASLFSQQFSKDIKEGRVLGIKGFSGEYFIITKEKFDSCQEKILASLKEGEKDLNELASEANSEKDACEVVLQLLAEDGHVYEKARHSYKLIN